MAKVHDPLNMPNWSSIRQYK